MELARLRPVYESEGPFVTVYLEGRSPGEDAGEQMRLRWRALRERLESEGATAESLDALESVLLVDDVGEQQTDGRVLVAAGARVVLNEPWDAALGVGDDAHFGDVPQLGAYVRETARSVRELVVITDQQGAQVRQEVVTEQHEPREVDAEIVAGGAEEGVHKPRGGGLAHKQIQRRADETVSHNAKDIAEHVSTVAEKFRPRVLVLAGEVQARTAVRDELPVDLARIVAETDRGGRDENASDEALADELLRVAGETSTVVADEYVDRLKEGLAHGQAVEGYEAVARAASMGAVDTVLFEHDTRATGEAELLKACAEIDSTAALLADGTGVTDGVAALLRFPVDAGPNEER